MSKNRFDLSVKRRNVVRISVRWNNRVFTIEVE